MKNKKNNSNPIIFERIASLETDVRWLKNDVREIKSKIKEIDQKVWYIISGIILSILITILTRIM
jgi:hypothetical protein